MAKFESKGKDLYIDGKKVLKGFESYSGLYWFATEKVAKQDSDMGDGTEIKGDTIWFGLVQGLEEEWGDFSEGEIMRLAPKVWQIPQKALQWSGRRS